MPAAGGWSEVVMTRGVCLAVLALLLTGCEERRPPEVCGGLLVINSTIDCEEDETDAPRPLPPPPRPRG